MIKSKNAQSIQDVLYKEGLDTKVLEFTSSARTAVEAAQTIGCEVAQIVKSLMFKRISTKNAILILVSGANRVNEKEIEKQINEKIEKADAGFTREITGFAIGGIPPIGLKHSTETFIDEDLFKFKEVWAAAGTPNAVFCIDPFILKKLTNGKEISVK